MALIRAAEKAHTGGSKFHGFCEARIVEFVDRLKEDRAKYPWADVYIDVVIQTKGSDYTKKIQVSGSFDKDPQGKVSADSKLLKRIYWLFDAMNCTAGVNADGMWEDEKGAEITDIESFLNDGYGEGISTGDQYKYYVYVYKEPDKKDPSKSWNRVHNKITVNDIKGKEDLEGYINFLKTKGYLKEAELNGVANNNSGTDYISADDIPTRL